MSDCKLINGKWLLTTNNELFNIGDLTRFRLQESYSEYALVATCKITKETVCITYFRKDNSTAPPFRYFHLVYPVSEIIKN